MHIIVAAVFAAFVQVNPAPPPQAASPMPAVSAMPATSPAPATSAAPSTAPAQPHMPPQQKSTAVPASFGDVIASLNNMRNEIAKIQAMNGMSADNLQPVNVATLNGANPNALNGAITRNQSDLTRLRSTLNRLTVTTDTRQRITVAQFLSDNKMSTSQIIGAHVVNGKLLLFYQK
jgi:hypothetical protein